jgi:hypothetical protein
LACINYQASSFGLYISCTLTCEALGLSFSASVFLFRTLSFAIHEATRQIYYKAREKAWLQPTTVIQQEVFFFEGEWEIQIMVGRLAYQLIIEAHESQ